MTDRHASWRSDEGPDDTGRVQRLHVLRDDQGDLYVSIFPGERWPIAPTVRLCLSGGVATTCWGLYVGISIAALSMEGRHAEARARAKSFAHPERIEKVHK